jgi:hypothetical protein
MSNSRQPIVFYAFAGMEIQGQVHRIGFGPQVPAGQVGQPKELVMKG